MGPIQSLADLVSMLRRRIVPFALVLSLGLLAALAYALSQPPVYEATSLIQLRNSGLAGDDSQSAARRLQVIEQRLMRRENVLALIEKHGLFADQPAMSDDDRLFAFREMNSIRMIDATGAGQGTGAQVSALLITSRAGNARQAAQVANDLAASLMAQDAEERTRTTGELASFLDSEARRLNDELAQIDRQIGDVKNANEEALPELAESLRTELTQLRELQLELDRQVLALERDHLEAEMRPEAEGTAQADLSVAARLSRLNAELARSRRVLPPDHPEVQRIEAEIQALRDNPEAAGEMLGNRETELIESQRAVIEEQKQVVSARQQEITSALERMPQVEQELAGLARRQAQLVQQLSEVSVQLAQAQAQQTRQETGAATGMIVLEDAQPPEYALASSRKRVLAMGGVLSLGAAFLLVFLMELRNPVMRNALAVERQLGVVPVAAVPLLPSSGMRARQARRFALALGIVLAALAAGGFLYVNRDQPEPPVIARG